MNKEVAQELKKKTGITLELQTVSNEDSTEALTSGTRFRRFTRLHRLLLRR